jgi:type III pantothenate kinase
MLLVIDVGNTNITFGLFKDDLLVNHWRLTTDIHKTSDAYGIDFCNIFFFSNVDREIINGIIISSVVPPVEHTLIEMSRKYFHLEPIVISPGIKTGISIQIENPKELGADRIVNAVAAYNMYKKCVIVVDFGTATTFDCISEKGEYKGGAIAPGLMISLEALVKNTSKLPNVDIIPPKKIIGTNTVNAMQVGIFYGYIGLVDGLIKRIKKESGESCFVIATGGIANLIAKVVSVASDELANKVVEEVSKNNTTEKQDLSAKVLKAIVETQPSKIEIISEKK